MAFTADVASTSSVPAAFGFTIKLRSFELNPSKDNVTPIDDSETETDTGTDTGGVLVILSWSTFGYGGSRSLRPAAVAALSLR